MSISTLGLIVGLSTPLHQARPDTVWLDGLDEVTEEATMPPGWQLRAVGGERKPVAQLRKYDGRTVLALEGDAAAGQCWRELDDELPVRSGRLHWRWRVERHLEGVDLRDSERDDAPARVFVVFGHGGLFSRPRILFYTWGGAEQVGDSFPSHLSDRLAVVVVQNREAAAATWYDESRDVRADFLHAFGEEPPAITAVGVMVDTDQLGGRSSVELANMFWIDGGEGGGG